MAEQFRWIKLAMNLFIGFLLVFGLAMAAAVMAQSHLPEGGLRNLIVGASGAIFNLGISLVIPAVLVAVFALAFGGVIAEKLLSTDAGLHKSIFAFYRATHGMAGDMKLKPKEEALAELRRSSVGMGMLNGESFVSAFGGLITDAAVVTGFSQTRFLARFSSSPNLAFMYDTYVYGRRASTRLVEISAIAKAKSAEQGKVEYMRGNILNLNYSTKVHGNGPATMTAKDIFTSELGNLEIEDLFLSGDFPARLEFRNGYAIVVLMIRSPMKAFLATKKAEAIFAKLAETGLVE